jgi:hypothetical protein
MKRAQKPKAKPKPKAVPNLDDNRRMPWPAEYFQVQPRLGAGPLSDATPWWLAK